MAADDEALYKREKELFVSGHTGGPLHEINLVCGTMMVSYFLHKQITRSYAPFSSVGNFFVDYFCLIVPAVLSSTVLADYLLPFNAILFVTGLVVNRVASSSAGRAPRTKGKEQKKVGKDGGSQVQVGYVTSYRASMMILTCIAILAVDFPAFPRRFAKAETYGISLMDIGVGVFVFSSGLVASRKYTRNTGSPAALVTPTFTQEMLGSFKVSLPVVVLGLGRMATVKGIEYQEHVSEYGVHWNFFMTLATLPPCVTICEKLIGATRQGVQRGRFALIGLVIAICYQVALTVLKLEVWILTAPRTNLIRMNKEGICSFLGYLSMYLIAQEAGILILAPASNTKPKVNKGITTPQFVRTAKAVVPLVLATAALWIVYYFTIKVVGIKVSRQQANLPYVLWVSAQSLSFLLGFRTIDSLVDVPAPSPKVPHLMQAINRNGLLVFLGANVLTGAVNLTLRTLYTPDWLAVNILAIYMLAVCAIATGLTSRVIRL